MWDTFLLAVALGTLWLLGDYAIEYVCKWWTTKGKKSFQEAQTFYRQKWAVYRKKRQIRNLTKRLNDAGASKRHRVI